MLACGHDASGKHGVCEHVRAGKGHLERFTGHGIECDLVCNDCEVRTDLEQVCTACRDAAVAASEHDGVRGEPGIVDEPSAVRFEHLSPVTHRIASLLDLQPLPGGDLDRWIGVTEDHVLVELDLDRDEIRVLAHLPQFLFELGVYEGIQDHTPRDPPPLTIHVSRDAAFAAIVQEKHGIRGLVVDLETGAHLVELTRDHYHPEHCVHSFAFVEHGGRTLFVHAPDWNRIDVRDPRTGEIVTPRASPVYQRGEAKADHYLDYFQCGLAPSPGFRWLITNGWCWHPVGVMHAFRLDTWIAENVWESEDGPTKRELGWGDYWDVPLAWIDDAHVAIRGYGNEDTLPKAVRIIDVEHNRKVRWFAGPNGDLVFDRVLLSFEEAGTSVWNIERGTRLLADPSSRPSRFHPTAKTLLGFEGATIHRSRLLGLDASYRTGAIAELADRIAREHAFDDLPVLGDALEAAGCTDREMLAHCQHPGEHAGRCWVLERLR